MCRRLCVATAPPWLLHRLPHKHCSLHMVRKEEVVAALAVGAGGDVSSAGGFRATARRGLHFLP